ncbi:MAG: tripartite tricarboxylate transporter substrate binding protein [Burkholderiales bacterium]|nr:tripartite tricarboxylate transporter substrate binding protein [Burkholderiales bacterium]
MGKSNDTSSRPSKAAAAMAMLLAGAAASSTSAAGQEYPTKPIRLIVPFAPGGGTDRVGRTMAAKMSLPLKQQMVVDNRSGAATVIGSEIVAKATPDGYTLLLCALPHATNPSLLKKLPYDTLRDFAPITLTAKIPSVLLVNAKVPAKSIKELVALSKSTAAGLNYGTPGSGTAPHLATELFKIASGMNAAHIPYKGAGPQVTALVSGQIDLAFATISTARAHVGTGRLRALAIATLQKSPSLPDVPTLSESGYPGFEAYAWFGLLAPAGTPRRIIETLNREANAALNLPDVRASFDADGIDAAPGSIDALDKHIRSEIQKWTKVIRQANITPE